jgi:hypothetical protein
MDFYEILRKGSIQYVDVQEAIHFCSAPFKGERIQLNVFLLLQLYVTLSAQHLINCAMDFYETLHKESTQYNDVHEAVNFCSEPFKGR